jgi:hypothetical protein
MNLEKIAQKVADLLGDAAHIAAPIVAQLPTFISLADEAADLIGDAAKALKGADKLKLVKSMAEALANELDPNFAPRFAALWAVLSPIVTTIVQLKKLGLVKF